MRGILIGSHERVGGGWLTGTTVVIAPEGAVGGVDVRGGGPGTRETDLLDPRNLVDRVHAVLLTGGSAYGLAAATGVMDWLAERGIGLPVTGGVVPIVPGAVLYDLGRGGVFGNRPTAEFGLLACENAGAEIRTGNVGAGAGAVAGTLKGGLGHAETVLPEGYRVEALVAVNPGGSCVDPRTGRLWGDPDRLGTPLPAELAALPEPGVSPLATTIGVVLTDATLTKAQAQKVAGVAHDGMARAIRPVHSLFDGDTVFTMATCAAPAPDPLGLNALLAAAADTFALAVVDAVLAARSVPGFPAYRDVFGSLFR